VVVGRVRSVVPRRGGAQQAKPSGCVYAMGRGKINTHVAGGGGIFFGFLPPGQGGAKIQQKYPRAGARGREGQG
jgi:hypothetical protein